MFIGIEKDSAINVYRTKKYIVIQELVLDEDNESSAMLVSNDEYYLRTRRRDNAFEKFYKERLYLDGKRVRTSAYTRNYFN